MPKFGGEEIVCLVSATSTSTSRFFSEVRHWGEAERLILDGGYASLTIEPEDGWDARITVGSPDEPYDSEITLSRAQALELAAWLQKKFGY